MRDVHAGADLSQQAERWGVTPAPHQPLLLPFPFTQWPEGQPWAEPSLMLPSPLGHGMEGSASALLVAPRA